ncbi:hypothetical protein G5I_01871 [Acromyrmex echinatior]|uniref:Uncharacterized protein n=1 Tax=Acromyrmex echinatior TaxID=103372 RepID=F4W8T4_ACREC|nr:hypothetical protein G5I_01871 [Acromyrmex echinatior]
MMMSPLEHVVTCPTMSNVREKSGHVTCTLFGNVAFISNCIDDIIIKTCRDMSNGFGCEKKKKSKIGKDGNAKDANSEMVYDVALRALITTLRAPVAALHASVAALIRSFFPLLSSFALWCHGVPQAVGSAHSQPNVFPPYVFRRGWQPPAPYCVARDPIATMTSGLTPSVGGLARPLVIQA